MTPWSTKDALKWRERANSVNLMPCALCGKPVLDPWPYEARIVEGGERFATRGETEGTTPVNASADLGTWPVGSACAKKLLKAGVYVKKL